MQGQVFVPYNGIGGNNMNNGIMTMETTMQGSTYPPLPPEYDQFVVFRIFWTYPGGINLKTQDGQPFWGYSVYTMDSDKGYSFDSTVKSWLLGQCPTAYVQPTISITEQMIDDGDPLVVDQINYLMKMYCERLINTNLSQGSDLEAFQIAFEGCWDT